jgi:hypothetical protein
MLPHALENHGFSGLGAGFSQELTKGIHPSVPSAYPKHKERDFLPCKARFHWRFPLPNQTAEIKFPITKGVCQLSGPGIIPRRGNIKGMGRGQDARLTRKEQACEALQEGPEAGWFANA